MGPIREMLATSGVNEQKWRVLRVLQESGPLELSQVAAEACLLLSSLTRMVPPMEEDGLIRRETPAADRRKVLISIAPAGEALIRAHAKEAAHYFQSIEDRVGADRLETLLDLLEEVHGLAAKQSPSGGGAAG